MDKNTHITQQLLLVAQLIEKVGDRVFAPFGLTIKTHQMLLLVSSGLDTTTALAERMNLTMAGVTQKTKVLEQKGFLQREANSQDLRIWNFHLTEKGTDAVAGVSNPFSRATELLLSDFSASEKDRIAEQLERISSHLLTINEDELNEFIFQITPQKRTGD